MQWTSLLLPFAYLGVLVLSLYTFSHLYRSRQSAKARSLAPWFPQHLQRDIYLSLLELQASPDTKVPDSVLKAALFRRAVADIHRLITIRNSKPALAQLLQRGSVGDELWQRFLLAEKEIEIELRDVVNEANALAPQQSWGASIFQSASEFAHNEILRKKLKDIEDGRAEEKAAFETRRGAVKEAFMKELGDGSAINGTNDEEKVKEAVNDTSDTNMQISEISAESPQTAAAKKKKGKK